MSRDDDLFVLASASPRRAALLRQLGLCFRVEPQSVDETEQPGESARDFVQRLAQEKAQAGWMNRGGDLPVLGADTIVVLEGKIFGKPADRRQACSMLSALSGKTHEVFTAVSMVRGSVVETLISHSQVRFRDLEATEIEAYWQSGEPEDKAGAYAIQGLAGMFVEELQGSYSGVVGLPLCETAALLNRFGIDVWAAQPQQRA